MLNRVKKFVNDHDPAVRVAAVLVMTTAVYVVTSSQKNQITNLKNQLEGMYVDGVSVPSEELSSVSEVKIAFKNGNWQLFKNPAFEKK